MTARRAAPPLRLRVRAFDFARVPTYWFGGDPWKTRLFDAFSSLLPVGEKFFIESLRRASRELGDAELEALVTTFAQQEGVHSREHRRYNERLRAAGYDLDGWDRSQKRTMWRMLGLRDPKIPLAITVAIEHITAMLGQAVLGDDLFADADPEMKAFWEWHWAEEIEHKGVAFEVYQRVGGGPDLRRAIMVWCLALLFVRMGARFVHMLRAEGKLTEPAVWKAGLAFLRGDAGLLARVAPELRAFFRRDFHPWQKDDYGLVERWEAAQAASAA